MLKRYGWEMVWRQSMLRNDNLTKYNNLFKRMGDNDRSKQFRSCRDKLPRGHRQQRGAVRRSICNQATVRLTSRTVGYVVLRYSWGNLGKASMARARDTDRLCFAG